MPEKYFPLRLVGPGTEKSEQVGQITNLAMNLNGIPLPTPLPTAAPVTVTVGTGDLVILGLVDNPLAFNEADLRAMEVVEITAEHPKKGMETYQGVRLNALLALVKVKPQAKGLLFTADDGYTAELGLDALLSCTDCLVAFTETPGQLKLVMPRLPSGVWVKGIKTIELK